MRNWNCKKQTLRQSRRINSEHSAKHHRKRSGQLDFEIFAGRSDKDWNLQEKRGPGLKVMNPREEIGEVPILMQFMKPDEDVMRYGENCVFTKSTQVLTLFRHRHRTRKKTKSEKSQSKQFQRRVTICEEVRPRRNSCRGRQPVASQDAVSISHPLSLSSSSSSQSWAWSNWWQWSWKEQRHCSKCVLRTLHRA